MADDERSEEEQAVAGHSALRLDVDLMDGDHLPLWCGRLPHHLRNNNDWSFYKKINAGGEGSNNNIPLFDCQEFPTYNYSETISEVWIEVHHLVKTGVFKDTSELAWEWSGF